MSIWARADDFMPDARGLAEQRRSPAAGILVAVLASLVVGSLGWSAWAQIEQVVVAPGRIESSGKTKIVNHPRGGRVAEILVAEGDRVEAGQTLLVFDPELRADELLELEGRWQVLAVETARLEAEAADRELVVDPALRIARPDLVAGQGALLAARRAAREAQLEATARQVEARDGEVEAAKADQARLSRTVKLVRRQLAAVAELAEQGYFPRLKLIAVEQQVGDAEGELAKTKARRETALAARAEAVSRAAALETEWRSAVLGDLSRSGAERDRLAAQLVTANAGLDGLVVTAPSAGIVAGLAVVAPGQAVAATDELLRIVPDGDGLVVRARVADSDAALIRPGQPAVVKLRAYDFLRYGTLHGEVTKIAPEATLDAKTGEPGWDVEIVTHGDTPEGAEPGVRLQPGMHADVELETAQRTVLSFFTDRLRRLGSEALREG